MKSRKFLFFYLNTGAGHISAARVLSEAMMKEDPGCQIHMVNGFGKHGIGNIFVERGYNVSCNYFKGMWPLLYDFGFFKWFQTLCIRILTFTERSHIRRILYKEHPTDIVSFHFLLSPILKEIAQAMPWKINLKVIVTDPFTVPYFWFYDRNLKYLVYSDEAWDSAVERCGVPEENVTVIPFLMNKKFCKSISDEEIRQLRIKHGYDPDKKIVLLVGGGEGLPGATEIINKCVINKAEFSIAIICGRDLVKKNNMNIIRLANPKIDLHVYGFIDYLDELVKICDCAVIKAGPATLMEVLSCRKPVIICKYLHNQELGNMHFAVDNRVGYFLQKPADIYSKVNEILNDKNFDQKMKRNFDSITIDTDAGKVAKILLS